MLKKSKCPRVYLLLYLLKELFDSLAGAYTLITYFCTPYNYEIKANDLRLKRLDVDFSFLFFRVNTDTMQMKAIAHYANVDFNSACNAA